MLSLIILAASLPDQAEKAFARFEASLMKCSAFSYELEYSQPAWKNVDFPESEATPAEHYIEKLWIKRPNIFRTLRITGKSKLKRWSDGKFVFTQLNSDPVRKEPVGKGIEYSVYSGFGSFASKLSDAGEYFGGGTYKLTESALYAAYLDFDPKTGVPKAYRYSGKEDPAYTIKYRNVRLGPRAVKPY